MSCDGLGETARHGGTGKTSGEGPVGGQGRVRTVQGEHGYAAFMISRTSTVYRYSVPSGGTNSTR